MVAIKLIKGIIGIEFIVSIFLFFIMFSLIITNFLNLQENFYKNFNLESEILTISAHVQNILFLTNKLSLDLNETNSLFNNLKIKYKLNNINNKSNNIDNSNISSSIYENIILERIVTINGKIYKLEVLK